MIEILLLLVGLAAAQQAPAVPSAPTQTFRSGSQVVQVDVRVVGKDGKFITDLGPDDFQLLEDGAVQRIQSAGLIGAPAAGANEGAPPDVWLFFFDTNHLGGPSIQRGRDAVLKFIDSHFKEGDLGGIVAGGGLVNGRITSDRKELRDAAASVKPISDSRSRLLEQQSWPRLRSADEAYRIKRNDTDMLQSVTARACNEDRDQCSQGNDFVEGTVREKAERMAAFYTVAAQQTLSSIASLSRNLARVPGTKTIVFLSEGFVMEEAVPELQQAAGLAARASARFYSLDVRGTNRAGQDDVVSAVRPETGGSSADIAEDGPNSLALDTGGFVIRNENNFGRAFERIQADASTFYLLAYSPTNDTYDGKYRTISVKVNRPGAVVRARHGYVALRPELVITPTPNTPPPSLMPKDLPDMDRVFGAPVPTAPLTPGLIDSLGPAQPAEAAPDGLASAATVHGASGSALSARLSPSAAAVVLGKKDDTAGAAARGWAAYERGDVVNAAFEMKMAASRPDTPPWVSYVLGLAEYALAHFRESAEAWEPVRRAAPEFQTIYFQLADAYAQMHEEGTALKVLHDAEQRWPADSEVPNAIGVIETRRGALDRAIDAFARATQIAPKEALGYFNLGRACQMRLAKTAHWVPIAKRWMGGEEFRKRAIESYQRYLELGGPYDQQAKEAIVALGWKPSNP